MGNVLFSEIYEPQIPIKENKVVFDGSQQADCSDSGSLVGQLATLLALDTDDRGGKKPQFLACSPVDYGQSYISCCSLSQNLIF